MCIVFPGVELTRAKFLWLSSLFMTEDLPTFDLPENTTCGNPSVIRSREVAADLIKTVLWIFMSLLNAGFRTAAFFALLNHSRDRAKRLLHTGISEH